jgi:hypothetical protein
MNKLNSRRLPKRFTVTGGHLMTILFLAALAQIALCISAGMAPDRLAGEVSVVQAPAPATNAPLRHLESGAFHAIISGFQTAGSRG